MIDVTNYMHLLLLRCLSGGIVSQALLGSFSAYLLYLHFPRRSYLKADIQVRSCVDGWVGGPAFLCVHICISVFAYMW